MYKILIWGTGKGYNNCIDILKRLEEEKDICIIGITSDDFGYDYLDNIKFISKDKVACSEFDFILVASKAYKSIVNEGGGYGIVRSKFLPMDILYIAGFSFHKYIKLLKDKISIVSNNCWGGLTYNYFHLEFLSPFINMFITDNDYIKLLNDFDSYMKEKIIYYKNEYNNVENFEYPVFMLGDIVLHMNHYKDVESAEKSWYRRLNRFNYDNVFFMMYTQSREVAEAFDDIMVSRKICFVDFECPRCNSAMFVPRKMTNKNEFWEYVTSMAKGVVNYYDPWSLLLNGEFNYRVR